MTVPGDSDPRPDVLSGGRNRPRVRRPTLIGTVAGALVVGALVLATAVTRHSIGSNQTAATPTPTTQRPAEPSGSVFLEHLPTCTRTDHHDVLTVAFGVSNLGPGSLVLLGAQPRVSDEDVLQLTRVRLGVAPCADAGGRGPVRLAQADDAVVAMTFHLTAQCPHDTLLAARVTFDAGTAGLVHSDSSALTDLSRLDFVQC
jgi:hypothetical protein